MEQDQSLRVVFIDCGQPVELGYPAEIEFLLMDLTTVHDFLIKQGIQTL